MILKWKNYFSPFDCSFSAALVTWKGISWIRQPLTQMLVKKFCMQMQPFEHTHSLTQEWLHGPLPTPTFFIRWNQVKINIRCKFDQRGKGAHKGHAEEEAGKRKIAGSLVPQRSETASHYWERWHWLVLDPVQMLSCEPGELTWAGSLGSVLLFGKAEPTNPSGTFLPKETFPSRVQGLSWGDGKQGHWGHLVRNININIKI